MVSTLGIDIYVDTADLEEMKRFAKDRRIAGFTTNPTLMRKAGVKHYATFAAEAIEVAGQRPISFEVLGDDAYTIYKQARQISVWGENVFVKVPIMRSNGESNSLIIKQLVEEDGVNVNVTAVFTLGQIRALFSNMTSEETMKKMIISVFAGRVANTGRDPYHHMLECACDVHLREGRILWASPRQVYDVMLAQKSSCDIITLTPALLDQLQLFDKDLMTYSQETVCMFCDDAEEAGYVL